MPSMVSEKCEKKWTDEGKSSYLSLALAWIGVREYKRVRNSMADVQRWDDDVEKAWNETQSLDSVAPGPDEKAFMVSLWKIMTTAQSIPGMDSDQCTVDWGEFAAFANWAAKRNPPDLDSLAKILTPKAKIPYTVDPDIKSDLSYASEWARPGDPKPPSNYVPAPWVSTYKWALIGSTAIGVGIIGYVLWNKYSAGADRSQS